MKLEDTITMMTSDNYKERFLAEYFQLAIRHAKLKHMLEGYKAGTLPFKPSCSYELLHEQLIYMRRYLDCLDARARIENVDISLKK